MAICFVNKMTAHSLKVWVIMWGLFIQSCVNGMCLNSDCQCFGYTMVCENGEIPTNMSLEIRELFIKHLDLNNVTTILSTHVSAVQKLDIQADQGEHLPQSSFKLFPELTYLGLHGKQLISMHKNAFLELEHLITLNLSSSGFLRFHYISAALNSENRTVLPNLVSLSVAKVKTTLATSAELDEYFFKSIASGRNLKHLDLSELNIYKFDFKTFKPVCTSIESVDLRRSLIGNAYDHDGIEACTSLRTVDLSDCVLPSLRVKFTLLRTDFYCELLSFYAYLENLFANRINTENQAEINGYLLDLSTCPFRFRKIHISGNRIKWFNMTVRLHETTKKTISELNLSYNGLEYVSPSVLQSSESLEILDISTNKLSVMQENYRAEFEVLFWGQTKLLYLNLSHNSLSQIPKQTFFKNRLLKVLDISFNKITKIDFSVVQLVSLEKLYARFNRIYTIEENARKGFQLLWITSSASGNVTGGNVQRKPFQVYLKGNQFTCACDKIDMKLIAWLYSTAVLDDSETISCKLNGDAVNIRHSAPQDTRHFCAMQTVNKVAMISVPLVFTAITISLVTAAIIKKRRDRKLQILSVISQIEMGSFPLPYLAFLSYCSEDMDLVVDKIYPQLYKYLSKMTHSNKQLVCCGDRQFRPGFALRYEVMRCVEESSVFIAVISRNFCRKTWCNLEIGWAFDQNKPVIMLMIEHVERKLMDDFLQKIFDRYTHATWIADNHGGHIEPDWKTVCTSIIQLAGKSCKKGGRFGNEDLV